MAQRESRKLAAILAADIAGYSALMGADEDATVRDLKEHQAAILPMIGDHGGRVIDTAGDGILAEFASVLSAVKCALAIQNTMAERNAGVAPPRRMQFRIGINQGDVVFDEARLYGDGVNIAARLESIADAGGICISGKVYDEVAGRIAVTWQDLGPQQLKNISAPVRAYRLSTAGVIAEPAGPPASKAAADKPSVAVLPFANMSGDSSQDYLGDGIVEDIITALSKFRWLLVIARNSSFSYKGRSVDVRQIARELIVRYIVEGSIRRSGSRLRVTAQLIDTASGAHIWAERYDRNMTDVFEVQDEITSRIVSAAAPELTAAEISRAQQKHPRDVNAWDAYLQALPLMRQHTRDANARAVELLARATQISPDFSAAYARLSACWTQAAYYEWDHTRDECITRAMELAKHCCALDSEEPLALDALASAHQFRGDFKNAAQMARRALDVSPTCTAAYGTLVTSLAFLGRADDAFEVFAQSERTNPRDPDRSSRLMGVTIAYFVAGRYEEAIRVASEYIALRPNWYGGYVYLAASHGMSGNAREGNLAIQRLLSLRPQLTFGEMRKQVMLRRSSDSERLLQGLEKSGLPP
jgi:TolB-like protein/class 3 adenylate cyclase/Flp pilus assembly protein TadD